MKKTYNVYSKNLLNFSVIFFFTLFFLGMSSSVSAQLALSRAAAGSSVDADYSITSKATIGVSDEQALEILESELVDVREETTQTLSSAEEAENGARWIFLVTAIKNINDKDVDTKTAMQMAHREIALQAARYTTQIQTLINADGIVREYMERLK